MVIIIFKMFFIVKIIFFLFLKFIFDPNILKNRKYFSREKQTHSLSIRFGSLFLTVVKDLLGA
jgi:hypothetical protein